jgi:hypothetical protein
MVFNRRRVFSFSIITSRFSGLLITLPIPPPGGMGWPYNTTRQPKLSRTNVIIINILYITTVIEYIPRIDNERGKINRKYNEKQILSVSLSYISRRRVNLNKGVRMRWELEILIS